MSKIRGKNTEPEIRLRKALWAEGLRYRLHYNIPGRPDLVFVSANVAVFIDGCFWHGCKIHGTKPATNAEFWESKIGKNIERDKKTNKTLRKMGWRVCRVWEHEIDDDIQGAVIRICNIVRQGGTCIQK